MLREGKREREREREGGRGRERVRGEGEERERERERGREGEGERGRGEREKRENTNEEWTLLVVARVFRKEILAYNLGVRTSNTICKNVDWTGSSSDFTRFLYLS